jgi:hypothetical protein
MSRRRSLFPIQNGLTKSWWRNVSPPHDGLATFVDYCSVGVGCWIGGCCTGSCAWTRANVPCFCWGGGCWAWGSFLSMFGRGCHVSDSSWNLVWSRWRWLNMLRSQQDEPTGRLRWRWLRNWKWVGSDHSVCCVEYAADRTLFVFWSCLYLDWFDWESNNPASILTGSTGNRTITRILLFLAFLRRNEIWIFRLLPGHLTKIQSPEESNEYGAQSNTITKSDDFF